MKIEGNRMIADEGKLFRRKEDKLICGPEYYLGYTFYINNEPLQEPKLEVPEDFEELYEEEIRLEERREKEEKYCLLVDQYIKEKYSQSSENAILRQRDTKPDVFKEYFDYCEECKRRAKQELGLD